MQENADPLGLGLDLGNVDTSRPVLPEQLHVLEIGSVEVKPNKAENGRNLVVVFKTVNESPDASGQQMIQPGYQITKYYPLQQSANEKAPDYKRDLAKLQDAVEGTTMGSRPLFQPFNYVGKLVIAKLKIRKDEEYGDSNEISKLEPYVS
jgi:hypothetical protein